MGIRSSWCCAGDSSRHDGDVSEQRVGGAGDLRAVGSRVRVAPVAAEDAAPYRLAVEASRERLRVWNPVNPADLDWHLSRQGSDHRTFLIHVLEPSAWAVAGVASRHGIVGKVNVTNVVRGRAQSAAFGYDAYDPYAGRGLFAEGLRLIVDLAFARMPVGMGLHRVEASVQPGNTRSVHVLRSIGFRRRGAWPEYLMLPDATGAERWRDHVTYGVTAQEWPAEPFSLADPRPPAIAVVLGGGDAAAAAARRVAEELAVPLLRAEAFEAINGTGLLAEVLLDCSGGAVVFAGAGDGDLPALLRAAGLGLDRVAVATADELRDDRAVAKFAAQTQALTAG